jgi:hypothetical protein
VIRGEQELAGATDNDGVDSAFSGNRSSRRGVCVRLQSTCEMNVDDKRKGLTV